MKEETRVAKKDLLSYVYHFQGRIDVKSVGGKKGGRRLDISTLRLDVLNRFFFLHSGISFQFICWPVGYDCVPIPQVFY